ncbi:MAG: hypothetical protein F6K19_51765 [Cyanothece sp. SIO1E1]|nr:hypothetical protein [Cyanothece sp. SIO1E1]
MSFNELVEEIQKLSTEAKEEIKLLLERYLIEERRDEIYQNYQSSQQEQRENRLTFSNDIEGLKQMMNET